jgi:excisionase family DNA binding protein
MAAKAGGAKVAGKKAAPRPAIPRGRLNSPELVKVLLTVEEAAHKLSVSCATVYRMMGRGELRFITIGRLRRVPVEAISEVVARATRHSVA